MIPVKCRVKHDPPHSHGDCITACIATIIGQDVPAFNIGQDGEEFWATVREWLRGQGRTIHLLPYRDDPRPLMAEMGNDGYYFLLCNNGHGNHAVVCQGGERIHDPGWYSTGISGPLENGYWIVGVIA